jgi:hypothetical protein
MFLFCSFCWVESISLLFVNIGWTVEKLLKGVFLWKFIGCSPEMTFGILLAFPCLSCSRVESIGILLVRIGWTDEKLFNRVFWLEIRTGSVFFKTCVVISFFNFFHQAAPIELIWIKIAWTVEKLFMLFLGSCWKPLFPAQFCERLGKMNP